MIPLPSYKLTSNRVTDNHFPSISASPSCVPCSYLQSHRSNRNHCLATLIFTSCIHTPIYTVFQQRHRMGFVAPKKCPILKVKIISHTRAQAFTKEAVPSVLILQCKPLFFYCIFLASIQNGLVFLILSEIF